MNVFLELLVHAIPQYKNELCLTLCLFVLFVFMLLCVFICTVTHEPTYTRFFFCSYALNVYHLTSSPLPLSYILGFLTNRLEPPSVSDGGDVSPVGLAGGLSTVEPVSPSDTSTEENLERDR